MRHEQLATEARCTGLLLVLSVILVALCATPGCSFETDPLDPSRENRGAAGSVAVSTQAVTVFDQSFTFNNSYHPTSGGGLTRSMDLADRMNACVRAWGRTFPTNQYTCDFATGRATCTAPQNPSSPLYVYDCRPNAAGSSVERCELGVGMFTAGYCLWNTTKSGWSSQHYLSGGKTLLSSEIGYTNRWFVK